MIITKMKVAFKINLYFMLFLINKVFGMCVLFYFVVFRSDGNNIFQGFFIIMNILPYDSAMLSNYFGRAYY